jgi:hypothetical protein
MRGRLHTDEEKATALAVLDAQGGNVYAAAKAAGVSESSLRAWSKGQNGITAEIEEMRQQRRFELADKLEDIAFLLAEAIPDKIAKASLQSTMISVAIAIDKIDKLRGIAEPGRLDLLAVLGQVQHQHQNEGEAARKHVNPWA